jgi:hypothetical protein
MLPFMRPLVSACVHVSPSLQSVPAHHLAESHMRIHGVVNERIRVPLLKFGELFRGFVRRFL